MPEKEFWELHVKTVKLSRSGDGSFGISIEGGADKGKLLVLSLSFERLVQCRHLSAAERLNKEAEKSAKNMLCRLHQELLCYGTVICVLTQGNWQKIS